MGKAKSLTALGLIIFILLLFGVEISTYAVITLSFFGSLLSLHKFFLYIVICGVANFIIYKITFGGK